MPKPKPKPKMDYEAVLAAQLDEEGIKYERQFAFAKDMGRRWRSDFHLPDYKLLIEVDGILYKGYSGHQTGSGFQGDIFKHNTSALLGYTTLRFSPAMVAGRAKEDRKGKPLMPLAIDTIKEWIRNHGGGG